MSHHLWFVFVQICDIIAREFWFQHIFRRWYTGVPTGTNVNSFLMSSFLCLMQPWLALRPIIDGELVPCIPTKPVFKPNQATPNGFLCVLVQLSTFF